MDHTKTDTADPDSPRRNLFVRSLGTFVALSFLRHSGRLTRGLNLLLALLEYYAALTSWLLTPSLQKEESKSILEVCVTLLHIRHGESDWHF